MLHPRKSNSRRRGSRRKKVKQRVTRLPAITTRMVTGSTATSTAKNSNSMEKNKTMGTRVARTTELKANTAKKMIKLTDRSPALNEVNHKRAYHIYDRLKELATLSTTRINQKETE